MDTKKRTARTVGILYIIGTVSGILSLSFMSPFRSLNAQDGLTYIATHVSQPVMGALAILAMGLPLVMIPVMMYPILKRYNETLAMGFVVFRGALEGVGYLAMAASLLLVVPVSQVYVQFGDAANQALGTSLLGFNGVIGPLHTIAFILGALMFYTVLYRSRLVPRRLSGWGLIGAVPYLAAGVLTMVGVFEVDSTIEISLYMPLAVQEMVLAVWLIVKGFNREAIASKSQAA